MMKDPFIVIGVPCGDRVHGEFAESLWAIGRWGSSFKRMGTIFGRSSIVANARNQIVEGAFHLKADYILMLDSDMTFPKDVSHRLLAHDKDIVGATYPRRGPPFDNLGKVKHEFERNRTAGLVEMSHMPTGCILIKTEALRKFSEPWFKFGIDASIKRVRGEDYMFCEEASSLGLRLWCDLDLSGELLHWYQYPLCGKDESTRAMHEACKVAANG